jgi:hypothetical protein
VIVVALDRPAELVDLRPAYRSVSPPLCLKRRPDADRALPEIAEPVDAAVASATSNFYVVEPKLLEELHAEMFKAGRGQTLEFCEQTGLRLVSASIREVPERQVDALLSRGFRRWRANGWSARSRQSCAPGLGQRPDGPCRTVNLARLD